MLVSALISANIEYIHTRLNSHGDGGGVIGGGGGSGGGGVAKGSMPAWPEILGGTCTRGQLHRLSPEAPPQIPRPPFPSTLSTPT